MMDVLLYQIPDGGEINVVGGITELTGDFRTMVYLCLFGGNEDDDGSNDNPATWWGNLGEPDPSKRYVSRTQYVLKGFAASSANLLKLRDAVYSDLLIFLTLGIASSVVVNVTIPKLNWVNIVVDIKAEGKESQFNFTENWRAFVS